MDCSDFVKLIAQKLDGSLPRHKVPLLEKHLSGCGRCRAELLLQTKIQEALTEEVHSGLSTDFTQRVSRRILEVARAEKRPLRWSYLVPAFAMAAVAAVLFFAGADLHRAFSSVLEPLSGALAGAATWAGNALVDALVHAGDLLGERASSLQRLPEPLANSLMATLLATVPAILGLYKVFAFLRE